MTRPDQVWVADITYVRLREEFVYLAVLMDVFTRRVRGWELGRGLDQGLTLAALRRAMRRGRRPEVHHSDQGVQYAATAYTDRLAGRGVAISMAAVGKPEENGFAERLMRTIREEEIDLSEYRDFADAHRPAGSVPGRRVQPEADPLVAGLPDPGGVRAAMAPGAESHGPAMNGDRNRRPPVSVPSALRLLPRQANR